MGIKIKSELEYGQQAVCKLTGFKGTIIGLLQYQNGCVRVCLLPRVDKDGKKVEGDWFDESDITGEKTKKPGGYDYDPPIGGSGPER